MATQKLCIPTLDPDVGGGILSLTRFVYDTAQHAEFEPYLTYNAVSWEDCITAADIIRGRWRIPHREDTTDEFRGERIGRVLPEVEIFDYLLNYNEWKSAMDPADILFGVSGNCLPLLPAAYSGRTFGCWVATTIEDERDAQLAGFDLSHRMRDAITRPILKRYERYVLRRAEILVALSEYTKNRIATHHGISRDDIRVLPFPIDTDRFSPSTGEQHDDKEILFVGRINDPRKNVSLLLRAFSRVVREFPDAQLTLIGDTPEATLTQQVDKLDIDDNVSFPGKTPTVVPYMQRASIFVLPSLQEGLGIVGLEAMSCGLPVVATRCGGPESYIVDEYNGYLVPKDDAAELSRRICALLSDDELRDELSHNAREHVVTHYAESDLEGAFVSIFDELRKETER